MSRTQLDPFTSAMRTERRRRFIWWLLAILALWLVSALTGIFVGLLYELLIQPFVFAAGWRAAGAFREWRKIAQQLRRDGAA